MKIKCIALFTLGLVVVTAGKSQDPGTVPSNKLWQRPVIVPGASYTRDVIQPVISLNGNWKIDNDPPEDFYDNRIDPSGWKDIVVPAQADMQGIRLQTGKLYAYKTKIRIPKDYSGKKIFIRFEGVSGLSRAYINGQFLKEHFGGFNTWTCDITSHVTPGSDAWLAIGITDPIAEKATSGFDAGGILRGVSLMAVPKNYLYRVNIETDLDEQYRNAIMKLWLGAEIKDIEKMTVRLLLKDPSGKPVALTRSQFDLSKNNNETILRIPVTNPVKWDAEHPELYSLEINLMDGNKLLETISKEFGFREILLKGTKLLVNGHEVKLHGAGRFDSDPVYGRYLSPEECWKEVRMLKEANFNFVRPSCYPASEDYLKACDKLGLYVQVENSVTFTRSAQRDTSLASIFLSQMAEMIEAVRSHPSVLIYELANETVYGINIGKTYQYAKAEDPTRPIIYSWSQSVPPGEPWPYDIFSYHYPDWDIDLGKPGVAVFNGRAARPLPTGMPVLHDEFAHGSSYYQASLARDPAMRDFWGHSIKLFWEKMFLTEGCLGGAMWAIIDDNAGGAWAYEWGGIDLWRRERPEYWHFKKAFSPIRINEAPLNKPAPGQLLRIPIKNWYDHTNLNELEIQWSAGIRSGKIIGPSIRPHQEGVINLPAGIWKNNDVLSLKFTDKYKRVVDEFKLAIQPDPIVFEQPKGPIPQINEDADRLSVKGKDFELVFSKSDGLIQKGIYKGKEIIQGGPFFQLTGGEIGQWKLKQITARPADRDIVLVTISGAYDSVDIIYDISIDGTGLINTEYTLGRFRVPVPVPRKIPWNNQDAGGFEEVGIYYILSQNVDMLSWKRHGIWSVYPNDHIGRNEGLAIRSANGPTRLFGKKPQQAWYHDERDFSVFGQYDIGGRGTNDFRSTKENIYYANAVSTKDNVQVRVESDGTDAVRMEVRENNAGWIDNNDASIKYTGSWEPARDSMHYYGQPELHSTKAGDFIEFTFTGTGIAWLGSKGMTGGQADVYIDGKPEAGGINFTNRGGGPVTKMVVYSKEGLSNSVHTIKIVAKERSGFGGGNRRNNNNNAPGAVSVPFDGFKVLGTETPAQVKLIINNQYNHSRMGLGNYMKPPILIGSQYREHVTIRLMDFR